MTDDDFVDAFESCTLPPDAFHHREHIRLARLYLDRWGLDAATARFIESVKRYTTHLGKSEKYHETMTIAWMRVVAAANDPAELEKDHLYRYYSRERLETPEARMGFVEPDIQQLP